MATVADIRATLASSRTRLEAVAKYNPYHGEHGHFAHGPGSATGKAEAYSSASHADVEPGPSDGKHGHLSSSGSHPSEHDHTKPTEVPKMTHATVREDTAALAPFEPKQPYYSQSQVQAHAHDMVTQRILDDPALLRAVGINPGRADYSATKARAAVLAKVQRAANTWAGTSGDSNPPALAFQRAVSEEFGLQKQWKVLERHVIGGGGAAAANTTVEATDALHAKHGPENRAIARAMYEHTQQELKDAGIESVTLFRGVRLDGMPGLPAPNAPKWSNYLKRNNIAHQPASSYTAELRLAASFAGLGASGPAPYQSGHVIVLQVPRERILAAGFTGLGTMYEREYVLLGGTTPGKNLIVGPDSRAPSSGVVLKPPRAKKWLDDLYALVEAQKYNTHHGVHGQFASTDSGSGSGSASGGGHRASTVDPGAGGAASAPSKEADKHLRRGEDVQNELVRANAKKQIVSELTNKIMSDPAASAAVAGAGTESQYVYGRIQQRVNAAVNGWAVNSGDNSAKGLSMQRAVAEEFGLHDQWKETTKRLDAGKLAEVDEHYAKNGAANRVIARKMYESTQAKLAAEGIDEVLLHRGIHFDGAEGSADVPKWTNYGKRNNIPMQPISSFTSRAGIANHFAQNMGDYGTARVISTLVPRERIFSTARTGMGALDEHEFVVLGGKTPARIKRITGNEHDEIILGEEGGMAKVAPKPVVPPHPPKAVAPPKVAAPEPPKASVGVQPKVVAPEPPKVSVAVPPKNALPHLAPGTGTDARANKLLDRGQNVLETPVRSAAKIESIRATANQIMKDPTALAAVLAMHPGAKVQGKVVEGREKVEYAVDRAIHTWAVSSDGNTPAALAFQRAVGEEFGLGASWEGLRAAKGSDFVGKKAFADADEYYAKQGAGLRAIARHMYNATQQQLAANGIKEVTLHRGMRFYDSEKPAWFGKAQAEVDWQPISSWTTKSSVAHDFATDYGYGNNKVITSARVPRERIFSFPRTGAGSLPEYEYIVLAGPGTVNAKQVK